MSISKPHPDPAAEGPAAEDAAGPSRFIVLLRHGIAEDRSAEKSDEERSLTPEGHARMKQNALGLERAFPKAQAIFTSPLVRASQTALWVAKAYRSRISVTRIDALIPGHGPEELRDFLMQMPVRRAIFVGHEPNLSANLEALIGMTRRVTELKKGGCYGLRIDGSGNAMLEWMLSPRVLRKLAER